MKARRVFNVLDASDATGGRAARTRESQLDRRTTQQMTPARPAMTSDVNSPNKMKMMAM
jgi:hypothetical protein